MTNLSENRTTVSRVRNVLKKRIPILEWLPRYSKADVIADFIAGLTVGLTMMPQSIAYAGLAGLPAQYGLYTAFIGSFAYVISGTVKEVSIGPTSLMALLTISYTECLPIEFVMLLAFLAGCVELLMGILELGFLVDFISPPITSGFTSATSLIIITAQLKTLFGLEIKSHDFIDLMYKIFSNLGKVEIGDTCLGLSCILFLYLFKKVTSMNVKNPKLKKTLWFLGISKNALTVLITAVIGFYLHHFSLAGAPFALSGSIPQGLPPFRLPNFSVKMGNETVGFMAMVKTLNSGVIVVPVIAVLANVAIAKSFTAGKIVDASQEMISLGICNVFGSCVSAMPSCGAFTRSAVASSSGVKTPLQGIYSGTVIILALSFLTPYFYYIPKSALSAVLIFAVSSLIDYQIFPVLWKCNKVDFFLCLGMVVFGTLFGVELTIVLFVLLNTTVLLAKWSRPNILVEVRSEEKNHDYIYVKPELGLMYPNIDNLSATITKTHLRNTSLPIALDCQAFLKIDYAGAQAIKNLFNTYAKKELPFALLNVNSNIYQTLEVMLDAASLQRCQDNGKISFGMLHSMNDAKTRLLSGVEVENEDNQCQERKMSYYDNV